MAAKPNEAGEFRLSVQRVVAEPLGALKAAQHFVFTRVGEDFQLDVGYFDMPNLKDSADKAKRGEESELLFIVTDRFMLSKSAFEVLRRQLHEIEERSLDILQPRAEATGAAT